MGEIFDGQKSKGQNLEKDLNDYIRENYKIPLNSADTIYQKKIYKDIRLQLINLIFSILSSILLVISIIITYTNF